MRIYTIGHSNRKFEKFIKILKTFNIQVIIDVRRFPLSKKFPWFSKTNLENALTKHGIKYLYFPELGGFRKEGYKNFAKTKEFEKYVKKLLEIGKKDFCILCAEKFWWKCHRRFIAEKLVELGYNVFHIIDEKRIVKHKLRNYFK